MNKVPKGWSITEECDILGTIIVESPIHYVALLTSFTNNPGNVLYALAKELLKEPEPIDMLLYCPTCNIQHIDLPSPSTNWTNPPHRSHLCHNCNTIWRPADVPTNGVASIKTKGKSDTR